MPNFDRAITAAGEGSALWVESHARGVPGMCSDGVGWSAGCEVPNTPENQEKVAAMIIAGCGELRETERVARDLSVFERRASSDSLPEFRAAF